jgi:vacuolar-type H+-ATPase subunit H
VFTLKKREEKADKVSMELTEEQYQEIKDCRRNGGDMSR